MAVGDPPPLPSIPDLDSLLTAASGARLSFGEAIHVDGRTVIPVARVRVAGRGLGRPDANAGALQSSPIGFIELSADGSRFVAIATPGRTRQLVAAGGAAAVAGLAVLGAARRVRARLPRGRQRQRLRSR